MVSARGNVAGAFAQPSASAELLHWWNDDKTYQVGCRQHIHKTCSFLISILWASASQPWPLGSRSDAHVARFVTVHRIVARDMGRDFTNGRFAVGACVTQAGWLWVDPV